MDFGAFIVSMSCFFIAGYFTRAFFDERKRIREEKK